MLDEMIFTLFVLGFAFGVMFMAAVSFYAIDKFFRRLMTKCLKK